MAHDPTLDPAWGSRESAEPDDDKPDRIKIGRYMHAEMLTKLHGKPVYVICGREGHELGTVEWYPAWSKFVFEPNEGAVFSGDCLGSLRLFLGKVYRQCI